MSEGSNAEFSSEDEDTYTAWLYGEEVGQIYFDSRYFHFQPTSEKSKFWGQRIKWKELKDCKLNSRNSPQPMLKLFFHNGDNNEALTFHLKSREAAEAVRDEVLSNIGSDTKQFQESWEGADSPQPCSPIKESQVWVPDEENPFPEAQAQPIQNQSQPVVQGGPAYPGLVPAKTAVPPNGIMAPQSGFGMVPIVIQNNMQQQQEQQQQQQQQQQNCCCGCSGLCCCITWSVIGILFVIFIIIGLLVPDDDEDEDRVGYDGQDNDYRRFLVALAQLEKLHHFSS